VADRLDRFRRAQDAGQAGFAAALAELTSGRKSGHWIWYVFPQLAGLGQSSTTEYYSIQGRAEALEYLRDDVLRGRLLEATAVVAKHLTADRPVPLRQLMGSDVDARKLVSSLTLFKHIAGELVALEGRGGDDCRELAKLAHAVLARAESEGYPPCRFTLRQLRP